MSLLVVAATLVLAQPAGVPRSQCFPIESLPPVQRQRAETLLLKAMDGEALYTIVGGLKPMSSGWLSYRIKVDAPDVKAVESDRQILRTLRCGDEVFANLQPFWRVYEGQRYLEGTFFSRRSVADSIRRHQGFFGFYGITPSSDPVEAYMAFELDTSAQRNRGYGYLYGYPDHAVDFFVKAEVEGKLVPRDFLSIPVYESETRRFVYAVPKGQAPMPDDEQLRRSAAPVLATYRKLRVRYIGAGKPGIVALVRDWFDDSSGSCSSETALKKAQGLK